MTERWESLTHMKRTADHEWTRGALSDDRYRLKLARLGYTPREAQSELDALRLGENRITNVMRRIP